MLLSQGLPIGVLAATIQTDLFVYQNRDTVTVTGDGFGATETVDLVTTDPAATVVDHGTATTDGAGNLTYQFTLNATVPGLYDIMATGETSGLTASTKFDPQDKTSLDLSFNSAGSYGTAVVMSGTLTDDATNPSVPLGGATVSLATYSNNSCSPGQLLVTLGTATTATSGPTVGQYTFNALPVVGSFFVEANYAGDTNHMRSSSSCLPLTIGAATTSTAASASVGSITPSGQTVVSWTVSSTKGVTGNTATGTTTVVKDSGPGTLTCSPTSVTVSAAQTTGSGFSFTAATSQKFSCSATVLGSYSYHLHFVDSDGNYTNSDSATIGLTVVSASSLAVLSASGTYGGSVSLQATLTSGGIGVSGKAIAFSLNGTSVGSAATNSLGVATLNPASLGGINAGSYATGVGASFAGDTSYAASSGTSSLTVTPASLTVTANDKSRQYGTANPALNATITGFKNGETLGTSDVTGSASCTTSATSASQVGNYTITCTAGSLASNNYTFTFAPGTLHVTQATLSVTADPKSKVYGGGNPALTYTITGFVNGDLQSVVSGTANCSTTATTLSGVGGYPITCTQGSLSATNYSFSFVGGTLTVTQATLTVTADPKSKVYGAGNPFLTYTISGFVNGDLQSVVSGTANCSTTANALSGVGGYPITCTQGSLSATNYNFSVVGGTLTVTQATLTVTADPKSKIYGSGNPALTYTISGFVNGDLQSVVSGTASCSTTANALSGVGGYPITCTQGSLSATNYNFSFVGGTLTVTQATLTVTADPKSKVYGAGNPVLTYTITGFVNADPATVVSGTASCTTTATPSSGVGGYPITCTQGSLSATNYSFSFVGGTLTVGPATLTVTADPKSKVYGAGNPVLTYTITGFVNGDPATVVSGTANCTTTATPLSGVGGYPITCTQGSLSATNYNFSFVGGTLTVTQATLTVTANDKTREYGDANPSFDATISGFKNGQNLATSGVTGTASCSSSATTTSPVADYSIACTIGSLSSVNYSFTFAPGTLHVTQAVLTVTANDKSRQYGTANPAFDATITGFKNGENLASSGVTGSPACSTAATPASPVHDSPYAITCVLGSLAAHNYSFSFANGELTVTPAPLVITADDKTKSYGAALPMLTVTYSGFVNGEDADSLTVKPAIATTATAASHVSGNPYAIVASGAVDTNYDIRYVAGILTVTPVPLTITADSKSKAYGAVLPALTVSYSGLVNGDTASTFSSAPNTAPTITTTANADSHVVGNPYSITASGAVDTDYTISYVAGTLTVTPVALIITADNKTKAYGADLPALTASYAGFTNGDTVASLTTAPTLATTATAASHVAGSPYAITASGAVDADYTISYVAGTLTVTPVSLVIAANNKTKAYGAALPSLTASYAGFVNGDAPASLATLPTLSTSATASSHVSGSPYAITASGAVDTDYTISYVAGTLTVTPVGLTITADNKTKAYGAALPTLTASFAGFVNSDTPASLTIAPTLSTTATATSHVSGNPYSISASGAVDTDYTISYVSGTLTVTPVGLTITANNQTKAYGAALPTLTASYAGLVNGDTSAALSTQPTLTTTATASSHVGSYSISVSGAADTDYTIQYVSGTLTVNPVGLTITADNKSMVLNSAALPALTLFYTGFVNGDSAASLTTQPTISTTATTSSPIGTTYPITVSGAIDPDYVIAYVGGTLTIVYASSGTCYGDAGHMILQPINSDGTSVFKQGSTVPAKFRVCDANGNSIGQAGVVQSFTSTVVNGSPGGVNEAIISTTPDTAFRWDSTGQQWIFNLSTKNLSANHIYIYVITLYDGSQITFRFGLK